MTRAAEPTREQMIGRAELAILELVSDGDERATFREIAEAALTSTGLLDALAEKDAENASARVQLNNARASVVASDTLQRSTDARLATAESSLAEKDAELAGLREHLTEALDTLEQFGMHKPAARLAATQAIPTPAQNEGATVISEADRKRDTYHSPTAATPRDEP